MKHNFARLKRKIIGRVMIIAVGAVVIGFLIKELLIDGLFQKPFADTFIRICRSIFGMSDYTAHSIYQRLFRNFKSEYLIIGLFLLMLIIFYTVLSQFTKYFSYVNDGIDILIRDSKEQIHLPKELDFVEYKLNSLQTTLIRREQSAREAEQRKNDLVVYLAHDLKTPLTSVIGYLSLLDEKKDMPPEQKEHYTGIALNKAYRLEHLINEFFDITRFNLQGMELNCEWIDLSYMLVQMCDEIYPLLASYEKKTVIHSDQTVKIYADPDKLARVFNNLLRNAAAYSFDESIIDIYVFAHPLYVTVRIQNTGATIPQQKLAAIFEKFYRLDEARSSDTGGSGLGLAIAREIIVKHRGKIEADSQDGVTVFTVTLPVSADLPPR